MAPKPALSNYPLPVATFDRKLVLDELVKKVARDPALVKLLEYSFITEKRNELTGSLHNLLPDESHEFIKHPWLVFTTYCQWVLLTSTVYSTAEAYLQGKS
jgi:hypothetical protein